MARKVPTGEGVVHGILTVWLDMGYIEGLTAPIGTGTRHQRQWRAGDSVVHVGSDWTYGAYALPVYLHEHAFSWRQGSKVHSIKRHKAHNGEIEDPITVLDPAQVRNPQAMTGKKLLAGILEAALLRTYWFGYLTAPNPSGLWQPKSRGHRERFIDLRETDAGVELQSLPAPIQGSAYSEYVPSVIAPLLPHVEILIGDGLQAFLRALPNTYEAEMGVEV